MFEIVSEKIAFFEIFVESLGRKLLGRKILGHKNLGRKNLGRKILVCIALLKVDF